MSAPNPYFLKLTETETLRFLDLYQKEDILWNSNLEMYRNRPARLEAAERVAKALNVRGFTAEYVLIKFKNLRSSYCQELKKVAESISSGAEEIYKPKVFWFHKMNAFLRPFVQSRAAQSNLYFDTPDIHDIQTQEVCTTHFMDAFSNHELNNSHGGNISDEHNPQFLPSSWEYYDEHSTGKSEKRSYTGISSSSPHYPKRIKPNEVHTIEHYNHAPSESHSEKFQSSRETTETSKEDSFDCFGKYVASLLRTMPPPQSCQKQLEIITMLLTEQLKKTETSTEMPKSNLSDDKNVQCSVESLQKNSDSVKEENNSNGFVDLTSEINYDS